MTCARLPRIATVVALLALAACVKVEGLDEVLARAERLPETTRILASDGSAIAELHAEVDREVVPLADVPSHVRDAVIAIEDARFYSHGGVDARGIARAFAKDLKEGGIVEGGSTITQQLVKSLLNDPGVSLKRKVREAILAHQLERRFTKDQILERYLNRVYFGRGAYGIGSAARAWFGVEVSDLTLPQGAFLAGVLRAPSEYDPALEPRTATGRRNTVLQRMRALGMVESERYTAARAAPLRVVARTEEPRYPHGHFVEYVKDRIFDGDEFEVLGASRAERVDAVFKGGLRIHTTLDRGLQQAAEGAAATTLHDAGDPAAALVAIRPDDGAIVTMVGGRDFFDPDDPSAKFNLAADGRRQPGSAFKPFALAAALEQGITLDRVYRAPSRVTLRLPSGAPWTVQNFEGGAFGSHLTLKAATALSVNVVYAQLGQEVGPPAVVDVAHRMGITSPLDAVPAIVLGTEEVTPLEMASAYASLAAGGMHHPPYAIARITDAAGKELWKAEPEGTRAVSPAVAAEIHDALQEVMRSGTGRGLSLGIPNAGKSGTNEEYRDAWFAGYTPRLAAVAWVGFPRAQISMLPPRTRIRVYGASWPGQIWKTFMLQAHRGLPALPFPKPEEISVRVRVDALRGCLPNEYTPRFLVEERSYVRGQEPGAICTEPESRVIEAVPRVIGLDEAAAARALRLAGIDARVERRYCPDFRPGTVCAQEPAAGARSFVGTRGMIALSDDSAVSEVPMVLGMGSAAARATLERAGYVVEVEAAGNAESDAGCRDPSVRDAGVVWRQDPCAGARWGRGATVRISANP